MNDLKFSSINIDLIDKPVEFLKHYLESDRKDEFSTFIHSFMEIIEKMSGYNESDVSNEAMVSFNF